ncbi:MAG: transcriptional regulator [Pirellulales bacterium]|nr:transcriptional regulator [Pirellulales bacterium]
MSIQTRISSPSQVEELPPDVVALVAAIGKLPPEHRAALEPHLQRVTESTARRRRILALVQDALSQLRLDMKYLVFDLEATRRERDEFQRQLDGASD